MTVSLQDAQVRYLKDMRTLLWLACTSREWRTVATQPRSVLGPSRKVNDCVRAVEQFPTYMRALARARWQMRGSPASLMTRGCQCIKAYYIVFANARFMYSTWELSSLLSNVETCSTSWSLLSSLKLGLSIGSLRSKMTRLFYPSRWPA
jgi:hypothetical protein